MNGNLSHIKEGKIFSVSFCAVLGLRWMYFSKIDRFAVSDCFYIIDLLLLLLIVSKSKTS